tara:strand:- start:3 stop:284 length:282 start_codon:yes stop_codon:yes gene_type:complete
MKDLKTPKEVFTYIRDTEGLLEYWLFICNAIDSIQNEEIITECHDLMTKHKPFDDDDFCNHKYWIGDLAWWFEYNSEALTEKRRFLTHLIYQL